MQNEFKKPLRQRKAVTKLPIPALEHISALHVLSAQIDEFHKVLAADPIPFQKKKKKRARFH